MRKKGLLMKNLIFVMITLFVQMSIAPNILSKTISENTQVLSNDSSFNVGEIFITSHGDESTCVCEATAVKDVSVPVNSAGETIDFQCSFQINITGLFDHAVASLTVNDVVSDSNETDDKESGYLHCLRECHRGDVVIWVLVADLFDPTFEQQERHFVSNGGGLCDLAKNPFWLHFQKLLQKLSTSPFWLNLIKRLHQLSANPFWFNFINKLLGHSAGLQRSSNPVVLASGMIRCM